MAPLICIWAVIFVLAGVFALGVRSTRRFADVQKNQPRNDVIAIQPVAEKWVSDHGECPTVERLRDERELSPSSKIDDPWGNVYRIQCDAIGSGAPRPAVVRVSSLGPDGKADTADDIRYPD
mgnify:CR=1 FL=1